MGPEAENDSQTSDIFAAMDDTMAAAFDKASAEDDTDAEEAASADGGGKDTGAEDNAAQEAVDGQDEGEEDTSATDDGDDGDTDQEDADGEGADDISLSPPERWSAEAKEKFNALTRKGKELVLDRERDVQAHLTRQSQAISEEKRRLGTIGDLVDQRREAWALSGFTPDQAITHIMALSDFATRDPAGFAKWFIEQHNIDLSATADTSDPQIKSLQQKVNQLEQQTLSREHAAQQHRQASIEQAINDFSAQAEKYPHFETLQGEIADILPAIIRQSPGEGPTKWLQKAYEKAVWANDATRQAELDRQKKADEATRREEAKKAAARARKSADTNVKSSGASPGGKPARTMEETMSEAYDRAAGAA